MEFISPTRGRMDLEEIYQSISKCVNDTPEYEYELIVGSDSQPRDKDVCFVTALVLYQKGGGGQFFYRKVYEKINHSMRQRVFYETSKSLELASEVKKRLAQDRDLERKLQVEIHLDVGQKGPTKELINEVMGMVVGSGYEARIKPDSYGAFSVADKYTK